jgi:asparagine synthetase B (glutamine-hydrolysing)
MVVADLGLTCANIFAQKGAPVLRGAGLTISYPFLSDAVVELGLAVLGKDFSLMPKEILRLALKRQAPAELVDRQKSGFTDPAQSVFLSDGFLEILDAAMDDSAPIRDLLVKSNVARACRALRSGNLLAQQTMNCLWAIAFTDRWYRTARGI